MSNDWIQTYSGLAFDLDLRAHNLQDLIIGASRENRFRGQFRADIENYCVLEHCCHMFDIADKELPTDRVTNWTLRTILGHDLQEGLLGDVVTPFKAEWGRYKETEDALYDEISVALHLAETLPGYVKALDAAICIAEKTKLLPHAMSWGWEQHVRSLPDFEIRGWLPSQARREWITRWNSVSDLKLEIF